MTDCVIFVREALVPGRVAETTERCARLAGAHCFRVQRVVVQRLDDYLPWTIDEVLGLGLNVVIVPSLEHIDYRGRDVLRRACLLVARPYGWFHQGFYDPAAIQQPASAADITHDQ